MTSEVEAACLRAASLGHWREPVDPAPLSGGMSNFNFLVTDAGRRYVVRIGGDVPEHGVFRRDKVAASRAAHAAGVAPEVVHAEPGALVLAFIEGRGFAPRDVRDPAHLGRIVDVVRRCHREVPKHLRGPAFLFWVFHAVRDYVHTLAEAPGNAAVRAAPLVQDAERLERAVGPVELVFGHNDLLAANFIDDGQRLWLVDWEYGGFNSPLFDLGGLASNSEMPPELRESLLEAYFERPVTDELRRRFAAMTAASLLRETLWSMVAEIHSTLDHDFAAYTAQNLARYRTALAAFDALERA
jgi:thiamine kinase-like enzyme